MVHTYIQLFDISLPPASDSLPFTSLGVRSNIILFLFTKVILEDKPIKVFNNGNMVRDLTYVVDFIVGVNRVIDSPPVKSPLYV